MREIKFRAWDTKKHIMDYNPEACIIVDKTINGQFQDGRIWLEYTGLKDKNGKEIHEGDMVEYIFYDEFEKIIGRSEVKWVGDMLTLEWSSLGLLSHHNIGYEFEIVGNIYENPELLQI